MHPVEFLGIVFRSPQHLGWFTMSMTVFAAMVGVLILCRILRTGPAETLLVYAGGMLCGHTLVALSAVIHTRFGELNGPVYSVDCIWFNTAMALAYAAMHRLGGRIPSE